MKRANFKVVILMIVIFAIGFVLGNLLHFNGFTNDSLIGDIRQILIVRSG